MKRLYIIRHAKSSWRNTELDDIDRPLNKRGKRDAPRMGVLLFEHGILPNLIISSPAKRARRTTKKLVKKMGAVAIHIDQRLYFDDASGMLAVISELDDAVSTAMLVAHNPDCTRVVNELTNSDIVNIPTCGVAGIEFHLPSWKQISLGSGRLMLFEYPKKLISKHG